MTVNNSVVEYVSVWVSFVLFLVDVKTLGPSHISKLWLQVNQDMPFVKYFCSNKSPYVSIKFHGDLGRCARAKMVTTRFSGYFACRKCEGNIGEAVEQEKKLCDEDEQSGDAAGLR